MSFFPSFLCKLLEYLKQVEFTNDFGEEMKFDENGDPVAMYDLINWQLTADGEVAYVTVGKFDETTRDKLEIDEEAILWRGNTKDVSLRYVPVFSHITPCF